MAKEDVSPRPEANGMSETGVINEATPFARLQTIVGRADRGDFIELRC